MNIELKGAQVCQFTHDIVWISCCYRYDDYRKNVAANRLTAM